MTCITTVGVAVLYTHIVPYFYFLAARKPVDIALKKVTDPEILSGPKHLVSPLACETPA